MIEGYKNRKCIDSSELEECPIKQFHQWFKNAKRAGVKMPNAAILSTVVSNTYPDSRTVMIKIYDDKGFIFFTDCKTKKVTQMERNRNVSLLFLWPEVERQIKVSGIAKKITIFEAFSYFSNKGDNIGCWIEENGFISPRILLERQLGELLKELYRLGKSFSDIFCGYRIVPTKIDFWQVCKDRLYQSFLYEKTDGKWSIIASK